MLKEEEEKNPRYATANFDRRKHPRFSIQLPVEYWPISDSPSSSGRAANISEGGLLLYLPQEMQVGQNIRLKLYIGSGLELESIEAVVQIVWKEIHLDQGDDYRIGVKFIDISPENIGKLKSYLNTLLYLETRPKLNIPARLLSGPRLSTPGDFPPQIPNALDPD